MHNPMLRTLLLPALLAATAAGAVDAVTHSATQPAATDPAAALRGYLGRDMVFVEDAAISEYLASIATRLLATQANAPPAPRMLIRSTSEFSIFTDTRGNVVVGTEVLRQAESEDELAAALSHELAHVIRADAQQKDVMQDIPFTVESAGLIAAAVDTRQGRPPASGQLSDFSRDSLNRTQTVGTVWADLVAPSWNRQQESDADLAGADMLRAAAYDVAAFSTLFSKIQAANAVRSDRVEAVRQAALAKVQAVQPAAGNQADELLAGAMGSAQTYAVETAFATLASFGTDYATPQQRADAVAAYLRQSAGPRRDKTARSPRFQQILRQGPASQLLDADRAGLALMGALAGGNVATVDDPSSRLLQATGSGEPVSPHLNLALGSWYDSTGKRDLAEQRAAAWTATDLATRSGYLWRASYQAGRREYDAALATLDLGATRLGTRSLFLPQMVAMTKQKGDLPAAEQLTLACAREDTTASLGTVTRLVQNDSKPSGLYAECTAALGYDPVAKAGQQGKDAAELTRKGLGLGRGLMDSLKKGMGK
jgi:hypothetical protein